MNANKLWHTLRLMICKNGYGRAEYLRKKQVFGAMGKQCYFHPYKMPADPQMIYIHNNVVVTAGVTFINHDIIAAMLNRKNNNKEFSYYLDKIEIFDNVVIGAEAIILPGVKIGSNVIVGAGTVVTHDIPSGMVVAGNPAKIICTIEEFEEKRRIMQKCVGKNRDDT